MTSIDRIVSLFKFIDDPSDILQVLTVIDVSARWISAGAYRNAFSLDKKWVLKIPYRNDNSAEDHALAEIAAIKRSKHKRYDKVRKHLPEVYYTDKKTGVTLMKLYKPVPKRLRSECRSLGHKLGDAFSIGSWDFHSDNFGMDGKNIVVLDLGLLVR